MSGIFDQIINYSPPLIVSGTVNYKGTWNASINNPTLNNPPVASTKGDYYVVSTAGTQFSITFGVGDWIISNGTAWEKVDLTDAVSSVFGRTGAVVGVSTDYSAVGITNTAIGATSPSTGAFTTVSASGLTVNDNTTLGSSNSDTVNFNARVASDLNPSTDNTYDLGVTGHEWRNLNIDGTANIDSLVADSADINGGTIDGTAIGGSTAAAGAFTTLNASGLVTVQTAGGTAAAINLYAGNNTTTSKLSIGQIGAIDWDLGVTATNGWFQIGGLGGTMPQAYTIARSGTAVTTHTFYTGGAARSEITSTGLNSTAIGATTPSTGAFTTLSASGTSLTLGTNSGSGTARRVFDVEAGGYASPGAFNTDSNGDKINLFKGGAGLSFDARIGVGTANNVWYRSSGSTSGAGVHEFYVGSTPTLIQSISSTGLAVTGALSSTGALAIGNTVATAVAVASTHKVTIVIGGVTYYLLATNV